MIVFFMLTIQVLLALHTHSQSLGIVTLSHFISALSAQLEPQFTLKEKRVDQGNYKVSNPVFCIINILSSSFFLEVTLVTSDHILDVFERYLAWNK